MVWRIARHEWTNLRRAGLFRLGALLLVSAAVLGLAAGGAHDARLEATRVDAAAREEARWNSQPRRDPHSASHFGQSAFHARSPLSAIDSGVDPYVGVSVFLEAHKRNFPRFPWVADTARGQGLGHYTAATALRVFLPLFIILLGHDLIAGERERGTLALLATTGARPWTLVLGKLLGIGAALALVAIPVIAAGGLTLALVSRADDIRMPFTDLWPRALALIAAYGAYSFVFAAITLAVSAWARSTRAALALLLAFWAVSALVAPRAVADVAQLRHPVPSAIAFERSYADDPDGRPGGREAYEAFKQQVLHEYGVSTVADLPVNFSGLLAKRSEAKSARLIDRHFGELQAIYDATTRFYARASWLGPTMAVDAVSMAMAGSDLAHYGRFLEAAEQHRRAMVGALNDDLVRHPPRDGEAYRAGAELWRRIGTFAAPAPSWRWALGESTSGLAALAVWMLAAFAALAGAAMSLVRQPHRA